MLEINWLPERSLEAEASSPSAFTFHGIMFKDPVSMIDLVFESYNFSLIFAKALLHKKVESNFPFVMCKQLIDKALTAFQTFEQVSFLFRALNCLKYIS